MSVFMRLAAMMDEDSEHAAPIRQAASRMNTLISDLLSLAKQGEELQDVETVALADIVTDAWALVDAADATLEASVTGTLDADPSQLQQLFENLFRNAVEHGGSDVTIRVGMLDDAEGFYVEDDGPGIPETEREHVFDMGYTSNEDGTGFGLNIVAEVVDAHDWEITVTEGDAGGARFEVTGVSFSPFGR